ncbi:nucleotide-sugar transporter-domain-containing protein [Pelagophyceae sp. CCMP2097]|nr:nucleotide-sugar transporter-domain-containing protein [Pelagophyceae sp. CCMP2097]
MVQFVVPSLCLCLAAAFSPVQAKPRAELRSTRANGRAVASAAPALQATATALQGGAAASLGGGDERAPGGATALFLRYRTPLLFAALIVQKVAADSLTQYTRARGSYSGATVSMLSEVLKFPVLFGAVVAFGGGSKRIVPTVVGAVQQQPFKLAWIAGAYAAQNVLYFVALGHISAASYQVLSQSKLIFTAFLAVTLLKERLSWKQLGALGALLGGSLAVQFAEMSAGGAAAATMAGGAARNAAYGGVVTVIGALLSALPNVWYEKLLKTEGEDEWVRNFQVTTWIFGWIAASQFAEAVETGA